jgi:hypothetical protein
MRKKLKRLTGELDVLDTYFSSFNTLLRQSVTASFLPPLAKVLRSLEDSIAYMKDLFSQSKLNVAHGKKAQRKVRYERLKTEFTQLIASLANGENQYHL